MKVLVLVRKFGNNSLTSTGLELNVIYVNWKSKNPEGLLTLRVIFSTTINSCTIKTRVNANKIFIICCDTLLILLGATSFNILDNPLGTAIILRMFYQI